MDDRRRTMRHARPSAIVYRQTSLHLMLVRSRVLVTARYLAECPTVLTSNDWPEALPARLQSRIAELAQIIWMPISDYRQLRAGDG
jgi:hypothetical protein